MIDQRAMIGDDIREIYAKAAKERMSEGGKIGGEMAGRGRKKGGCPNGHTPIKGKSRDLIGHMMGNKKKWKIPENRTLHGGK